MTQSPVREPSTRRRTSSRPIPAVASLPFAHKLRPPTLRDGIVERNDLIARLQAATDAHLITLVAPAGFGKTTLLAQWIQRERRPTAWVSLDHADNDATTLLEVIATALLRAGLIHREVPTRFSADTVVSRGVGEVARAAEGLPPGLLILDNLDNLRSRTSRDVIAELVARLPPTTTVAITSTRAPSLPVAVLRTHGTLLELTASDLAMDETEAAALYSAAEIDLGDALAPLVASTEGWPVGLYLVALAIKAGAPQQSVLLAPADDRFVADYLRHEVVDRLSPSRVSFLTRTAILERMTGPLCDAVLETTGSMRVLASLEDSNLLIVPLDRTRTWYRYNRLFRDLLSAELQRREPEVVADLHIRAATWFEANGMPDEAIRHAQAAGDADRVARLVARVGRATYSAGRVDTVLGWLEWFEETSSIDRYPDLAVIGALAHALGGDAAAADRWAAAVFGPGHDDSVDAISPLAHLVRSLLGPAGIDQMLADATTARRDLPANSEWRTAALVAEGLAQLWMGVVAEADPILAEAAEAGERYSAPAAATTAHAARAAIASAAGDWAEADRLASRSLSTARMGGLTRSATSCLGVVMAARCALHRGDIETARLLLGEAATARPLLSAALPGLSVQTLLETATAYTEMTDIAGARQVLREVGDILSRRPDLGLLPTRYAEMKERLATMPAGTVGASALTAAELRLLPLLVTHLSFPEIGERLYISRHTVKTQAMSIYRKLGASSRSEAVAQARQIGLLGG